MPEDKFGSFFLLILVTKKWSLKNWLKLDWWLNQNKNQNLYQKLNKNWTNTLSLESTKYTHTPKDTGLKNITFKFYVIVENWVIIKSDSSKN